MILFNDPASGVVWSKTDHGEVVLYNSLDDFYDSPTANNDEVTHRDIYENMTKKYYNSLSD